MRSRQRQVRPFRRPGPESRRGTAAVEFAICLPLMLLITFGAIEAANGIYLKQIVTQAAYEGARVVTTPGATHAEAEAFSRQVLEARQIQAATVQITPPVSSTTPAGTEVTVTVTAPSNSNAFAPLWYFRNAVIRAQVVMVRN